MMIAGNDIVKFTHLSKLSVSDYLSFVEGINVNEAKMKNVN